LFSEVNNDIPSLGRYILTNNYMYPFFTTASLNDFLQKTYSDEHYGTRHQMLHYFFIERLEKNTKNLDYLHNIALIYKAYQGEEAAIATYKERILPESIKTGDKNIIEKFNKNFEQITLERKEEEKLGGTGQATPPPAPSPQPATQPPRLQTRSEWCQVQMDAFRQWFSGYPRMTVQDDKALVDAKKNLANWIEYCAKHVPGWEVTFNVEQVLKDSKSVADATTVRIPFSPAPVKNPYMTENCNMAAKNNGEIFRALSALAPAEQDTWLATRNMKPLMQVLKEWQEQKRYCQGGVPGWTVSFDESIITQLLRPLASSSHERTPFFAAGVPWASPKHRENCVRNAGYPLSPGHPAPSITCRDGLSTLPGHG
jgi:hypothetical protein